MKKQRICIVGDGLSGLTTALALESIQNVEIHLILNNLKKINDFRTTAISESNFQYLKSIFQNFNSKLFWPSKSIKLFFEISKKNQINFLNFEDQGKNLMYVFENSKLKSLLLKGIKKKKIKTLKKNVKNLDTLKNYDLIILCLGTKSPLYKIIDSRNIEKDYQEFAITGQIKSSIKNIKASQFFLKDGPLAILPFSKNEFSFVWTVSKKLFHINAKNIKNFTKEKIQSILKDKNNFQIKNLQHYPIRLNLKTNYFKKNVLVLGEGLHRVHPIAGQGFNLVLRDIKQLRQLIYRYSSIGMELSSSRVFEDFTMDRKPENILIGVGIDITRSFFKKNDYLDPVKKFLLENLNKIPNLKKISSKISDTGINFN